MVLAKSNAYTSASIQMPCIHIMLVEMKACGENLTRMTNVFALCLQPDLTRPEKRGSAHEPVSSHKSHVLTPKKRGKNYRERSFIEPAMTKQAFFQTAWILFTLFCMNLSLLFSSLLLVKREAVSLYLKSFPRKLDKTFFREMKDENVRM